MGELNAQNEREAYLALQHQGLIAVEFKEVDKGLIYKISEYLEKFRVGEKWTALFFRQLSTTLDVMNLKDALNLFLLSTNDKAQRQIIQSILEDIEVGKTLAEAMEKHSLIFSHNIIQMMNIAQRSGRMQEISEKLAEQLEKNYKAKKKLQSALYYPGFVLAIAIIAMIILMNVVLPTFAGFFKSQGTELPTVTQFIISVSVFITENIFLMICITLIIIVGCIWIYKNSPQIQIFIDKYILKLPFVGKLMSQREWMNAFGALSFLLESGIQIDEAISMVGTATSNRYLRSIWSEIKYEVERGGQMQSEIFPIEYQGLIAIGEASGTLPDMLRRCEKMSEFEVEELSKVKASRAGVSICLLVPLMLILPVYSLRVS